MAFGQVSHAYEIKEVPRHSGEIGGGNAILACGKVGRANFTTPTNFSQVAGTCQIRRRAEV